jgi:hypothetical protein
LTRNSELPLGVKVIIGFHLLSFATWFFGQSVAVVAYDKVVEWGLQDPRAHVDPIIVEVNRAIGLTDTIVMLPLFVLAAIGLFRRKFYGAVASWLVFGMTLYWPVMAWCSQGFYAAAGIKHAPIQLVYIILPGALWLIACWGSWYLAKKRGLFR